MATIASFVDAVLDDMDGCNKPAAKKAIRSALIEWCKETESWQYEHDDIPLLAGFSEIEISIPAGSRLRRITNMLNTNGDEVIEKDARWLDENVLDWRTETGDGPDIKYFHQYSPEKVVVAAVPLTTVVPGLLGVKVILVPTQDGTEVGDLLYDDYLDDIADGAKYRLMRQKGKPWSDPDQAATYLLSFKSKMRDARWQANKGFSGGVLNVASHDYENSTRAQNWFKGDDS